MWQEIFDNGVEVSVNVSKMNLSYPGRLQSRSHVFPQQCP